MNEDIIFVIAWFIFAALILIASYGYKFKVLKTLSDFHSEDNIEEFLPSKQLKQIQKYKKICIENGLHLKWYWFMVTFPVLEATVMLLGVVLPIYLY